LLVIGFAKKLKCSINCMVVRGYIFYTFVTAILFHETR